METPIKILLDRKREGRELAASEIRALIAAYTKGEVPDYQTPLSRIFARGAFTTDSERDF